jgi:small subunit ribosomal protein S8
MKTDSIADLLTRVRNAQRAGHKTVRILKSSLAGKVLEVLKGEGFIDHVETKKDAE